MIEGVKDRAIHEMWGYVDDRVGGALRSMLIPVLRNDLSAVLWDGDTTGTPEQWASLVQAKAFSTLGIQVLTFHAKRDGAVETSAADLEDVWYPWTEVLSLKRTSVLRVHAGSLLAEVSSLSAMLRTGGSLPLIESDKTRDRKYCAITSKNGALSNVKYTVDELAAQVYALFTTVG